MPPSLAISISIPFVDKFNAAVPLKLIRLHHDFEKKKKILEIFITYEQVLLAIIKKAVFKLIQKNTKT